MPKGNFIYMRCPYFCADQLKALPKTLSQYTAAPHKLFGDVTFSGISSLSDKISRGKIVRPWYVALGGVLIPSCSAP